MILQDIAKLFIIMSYLEEIHALVFIIVFLLFIRYLCLKSFIDTPCTTPSPSSPTTPTPSPINNIYKLTYTPKHRTIVTRSVSKKQYQGINPHEFH